MKLNRKLGLLIVAAATVGGAVVATAATTTAADATATTPATGKHWHHHHGSLLVGTMLHAAHQLNLTTDQQAQIKTILSTARTQHQQAASAGSVDMMTLANPDDPNYATALQNAKSMAATRLQRESELQGQIYAVLTPAQKSALPQVLAAMKTKAQARRAAWQQQHPAGAAGSN
jgi:Spy/CpxP family protein refolding chaperone